jgi:hypothetical protein
VVINIPQIGSFVVCFCLISFRFVLFFWLLLILGERLRLFSFMRFSAVVGLLSTLSVVLAS